MLSPFPGGEPNRRVMIFASNLRLAQGETSSAVVVNLIDTNNATYDIQAAHTQDQDPVVVEIRSDLRLHKTIANAALSFDGAPGNQCR